jgi:DNA-binding NarL/FixJ family response regulator
MRPQRVRGTLGRMRTLYEDAPILRLVSDEPATVIRALVAEGHGLVRAGVRRLLEDQEDVTVTGEAGSGEDAVRLARRTRPDVCLLFDSLPGVGAVAATSRIIASCPSVQVLVVVDDASLVAPVLRAGARGVLMADSSPRELVRAVRVLASGEAILSPSLTSQLIARWLDAP